MGQPISEARKAEYLKRAERRLTFAQNLPADDITRDAKIKAAEKALKTAYASHTAPQPRAKKKKQAR
jgi:hypothetical protein